MNEQEKPEQQQQKNEQQQEPIFDGQVLDNGVIEFDEGYIN